MNAGKNPWTPKPEAPLTGSAPVFLFAHISDPHLSDPSGIPLARLAGKRLLGYLSWLHRRRHEHSQKVLDALKRDLARARIKQVFVSGDLTHLGLPQEFRQAREWLDSLGIDCVAVVPGNHDSYATESWERTYRQWLPYIAGDGAVMSGQSLDAIFPSVLLRDQLAFIGLSSARPTPPFLATGRIGSDQLQLLGKWLAQCGQKRLFRVVWLHHPPLPGQAKWRKRLDDAEALIDVIRSCGAELILHGHRHRSDCRLISAGGKDIPVLGVPSASAMGLYGEVALYNRLSIETGVSAWRLLVEARKFDRATGEFSASNRTSYTISRS